MFFLTVTFTLRGHVLSDYLIEGKGSGVEGSGSEVRGRYGKLDKTDCGISITTVWKVSCRFHSFILINTLSILHY